MSFQMLSHLITHSQKGVRGSRADTCNELPPECLQTAGSRPGNPTQYDKEEGGERRTVEGEEEGGGETVLKPSPACPSESRRTIQHQPGPSPPEAIVIRCPGATGDLPCS
eukprot:768292-Hanusia_phi.AAC.3